MMSATPHDSYVSSSKKEIHRATGKPGFRGKCRDCAWVGILCHKRSLAKGDADVHRNYWDQA